MMRNVQIGLALLFALFILVPIGISIWIQVVPSADFSKLLTDIGGMQTLITVAIVIGVVVLLIFVTEFRKFGLWFIGAAVIVAAFATWLGHDNFRGSGLNIGSGLLQLTGNRDGGSDFRTVTNSFVGLPKGGTDTFYAEGTIRVRNHKDYCLNISPEKAFTITWTGDLRVVYITPKSGSKELISLTSLPCNVS